VLLQVFAEHALGVAGLASNAFAEGTYMALKAGIYSDMGRNTCAQAWSTTDQDLPKGSVAERELDRWAKELK